MGLEVGDDVGSGVGGGSVLTMTVVLSSHEGPLLGLPFALAVITMPSPKQKSSISLSAANASSPAINGFGKSLGVKSFGGLPVIPRFSARTVR